MALSRFVLTATVPLAAGTFTDDAATGIRFGTGSNAQGAGLWGSDGGVTFLKGTVIYASSLSSDGGAYALYTAIGAGNLRAFVDGQDTVGHASLSN
jgi:hypothetical protein